MGDTQKRKTGHVAMKYGRTTTAPVGNHTTRCIYVLETTKAAGREEPAARYPVEKY
jgi:hypothetical protein